MEWSLLGVQWSGHYLVFSGVVITWCSVEWSLLGVQWSDHCLVVSGVIIAWWSVEWSLLVGQWSDHCLVVSGVVIAWWSVEWSLLDGQWSDHCLVGQWSDSILWLLPVVLYSLLSTKVDMVCSKKSCLFLLLLADDLEFGLMFTTVSWTWEKSQSIRLSYMWTVAILFCLLTSHGVCVCVCVCVCTVHTFT